MTSELPAQFVRKAATQEAPSTVTAPAPASASPHVTNEIVPAYKPHTGERSQCVLFRLCRELSVFQFSFFTRHPRCRYLRDVILGVNDGLVSMFLLILGVRSVASSPSTLQWYMVLFVALVSSSLTAAAASTLGKSSWSA
jgi:hypothetical protein